ncbi:MAG: M48 family metallopeptidase [bacterium]|nr:M48 family metallopeptidase [bacterium]
MSHLKRALNTGIVFLLCLGLFSCATTGPGGKQSLIIIPTSQEVAIGAGMAEQVAQTEKELADSEWQMYLNEIGQKIVAVCDRQDIEYHFTVIESDQLNAFAAPGGYIYFYTGLIKEMHNEAELAAVVAHEISHVVGRHGIRRLQTALGVAAALELIAGDSESGAVLATAVNVGMGLLLFPNYSRNNEREADEFGMHYMIKAGYDPNAMVTMFDILAEKGGSASNVFEKLASSHPDTQERISNAQKGIQAVSPLPSGLTLGESRFGQMKQRLP